MHPPSSKSDVPLHETRHSISDITEKKALDRLIGSIKARIEDGDLSGVRNLLGAAPSPALFKRIREQKLILRASFAQRDHLVALLRDSSRTLEPADQATFGRYLDFAVAVSDARTRALAQLHTTLRRMPRGSLVDLLWVAEEVFDWFLRKQFRLSDASAVGVSVATAERRLHNLNGAINDITMACARSVNESTRISPPASHVTLNRAQRRIAREVLRQALIDAGEVNSLEWIFDLVSFGELAVGLAESAEASTYRLQFADAKRSLLAELSVRRAVVLKYTGQRQPRLLREKLQELGPTLLERAIEYYIEVAGATRPIEIDLNRARHTAEVMLRDVGAEDDLLLLASRSDERATVHYVASIAMRWYGIAAKALRASSQLGAQRWLAIPPIPLEEIAVAIGGVQKSHVSLALESLTVNVPARHHSALVNRPFVLDGSMTALPFLSAEVGDWTGVVRETLIQGGALGKSVGSVWEQFYAQGFDGTGWRVVGTGVKLRAGGRTLTDVDLLLLRDDLLLVLQIKAMTGLSSGNPYENWRSRETVQLGCAQAHTAADFLMHDRERLAAICGKRAAERIRHVQPVVLTNIGKLDGWRVSDVPVISAGTLSSIKHGARVDYRNSRSGEVVHTHHFVKPEDLTTAGILKMFDEPLEMKIAEEGLQTAHRKIRVGGVDVLFPEFVIANDCIGVHEPSLDSLLPNESGAKK